jgi:hypothetical protein
MNWRETRSASPAAGFRRAFAGQYEGPEGAAEAREMVGEFYVVNGC